MFPESSPSPTARSGDIAGLPDPPTLVSLANAKLKLTHHVKDLGKLNDRIAQAEAHLAQIVLEARCAINEMAREKSDIEDQILLTRSYLSPIRRLPSELLSYVFYWCFDEHPCCAWILSAIRLLTTQHSSPDIIRLWLERSGPTVPLDIEIYLRVVNTSSDISPNTRIRGRRSTSPASPAAVFYSSLSAYHHHHQVSFPGGAGSPLAASPPVTHYVIPHPATPLPPAHTPLIVPLASHPVTSIHDGWSSPISSSPPSFLPIHAHRERRAAKYESALGNGPRNGMHWGWIVMFYLVEQMHRWERFVFRFDKHFNSITALKSINGEAPLLKEFEVSSAEPGYYRDSAWLPTLVFPSTSPSSESSSTTPPPLQSQLRSLTLQNAPFKWSSTMFHTNLHTLNLRALPTTHLSLDRITHILQANRTSLRCLSLHFQCVTLAVLPLNPIVLPELTEFSIGGHYYLSQLVETLNLPSLEEFNIDIEARDPIEDVIQGLVTRMGVGAVGGSGGIKHLSVAYGYGCGRRRATNDSASTPPTSMYYGAGSSIMSWAFLMDMGGLESLRVGGTQMDTLLSALGAPDDDMLSGSAAVAGGVPGSGTSNGWLCPNLTELALKHCHAHLEGVGKLVQVVDARNPDVGGSGGGSGSGSGSGSMVVNGVAPTKLTSLELHDCAVLGPDVLDWLKARVEEVVVTEPLVERSSMSPY
ncbi:hypothetical protein AAF712_001204 [Marasmius tenuissimus]|uniref:F-box domain-containing protein n=1 Tax=Marasmius tenuissimus TaxID=585030 RepID=A0ABR3ADA0_9AGAR